MSGNTYYNGTEVLDSPTIIGTATFSAGSSISLIGGVNETSPLVDIKQTPTGATINSIVTITADSTNWSANSACLDLRSADADCYAIRGGSVVSPGIWYINRSGTFIGNAMTLANDITMTGGGSVVTTANGDLTMLPNGTGITIIGDAGSPNHLGTPTNDDGFVAGRFESQGITTHGDASNYAQFAADGELTLAGTARVTKSIDIGNANLGKGASAPTEVIVGNFTAWEFGVNDDAVFDIIIPHDIAAGTDMTLNVVWQINEAGGDEVQWQIDYESIPADSSQAIGGAGTQVKSGDVVVPGTVRFLTETPMTIIAANIAANEHCGITLTRIAIDDGVAPANEPGVVDIHIEYISDKLGEAT
jgi:hypothetical protein